MRVTVRIQAASTFSVDREVGFDYITDPTKWPEFWPDLVDIPDLDRARWQAPADTMRLRMRLAGRVTELRMTLTELSRPVLVRYETVQAGMPDVSHERYFEPAAEGFTFRLVVTYAPRAGFAGLVDRTVLRFFAGRALRRTLQNLAHRLPTSEPRAE